MSSSAREPAARWSLAGAVTRSFTPGRTAPPQGPPLVGRPRRLLRAGGTTAGEEIGRSTMTRKSVFSGRTATDHSTQSLSGEAKDFRDTQLELRVPGIAASLPE